MEIRMTVIRWKVYALLLPALSLAVASAEAKADPFKAKFRGSVVSEYTDNLFHLSTDDFDAFDPDQVPGERFFDLEDPEDIVTRIRLKGALDWRVAKKREFGIDLEVTHYAHARNSISDYSSFDVEFGYDVTRRDRIHAGADMVFGRFAKNYAVAATGMFEPAVYDQAMTRLGYARRIGKHLEVGAEVRKQDREYDAPVQTRDRAGDYLAGHVEYETSKRVTGRTSFHVADIETPIDTAALVPEDRSFDEWMLGQSFEFRVGKKTGIDLSAQIRQRDFSTAETLDLGRFDRTDRRLRVKVVVSRKCTRRLSLRAHAGFTNSDSDRLDPASMTDEVGYDETVLGFGLGFGF